MKQAYSIILAVCEAAVGVLLLINPVEFTRVILTVGGVLLLFAGAQQVVRYVRMAPDLAAAGQYLTKGILLVLAGIFLVWNPTQLIAAFPILSLLYGIGTLVLGVFKVEAAVDLVRLQQRDWFWTAICSVVTLICAAVLLINPFPAMEPLWIFSGIAFLMEAVLDCISIFLPDWRGPRRSGPASVPSSVLTLKPAETEAESEAESEGGMSSPDSE